MTDGGSAFDELGTWATDVRDEYQNKTDDQFVRGTYLANTAVSMMLAEDWRENVGDPGADLVLDARTLRIDDRVVGPGTRS